MAKIDARRAQAKRPPRLPQLGFHLTSWDSSTNRSPRAWRRAVDQLYRLGIRRLSVTYYRYYDPETGSVSRQSKYGQVTPPRRRSINAAMHRARQLGMKASLYPYLEIDQAEDAPEFWRGDLRLSGIELQRFFEQYNKFIWAGADLARRGRASIYFIGSELPGLTTEPAAGPYWQKLILGTRKRLRRRRCLLTYASHHDEYLDVPFWSDLDLISLNAYFPLITAAAAEHLDQPTVLSMRERFAANLAPVNELSRYTGLPVQISEWGITPQKGAALEPWSWTNSTIEDGALQVDAYKAVMAETATMGDWLVGVDFWHWRIPTSTGSAYAIGPRDRVAAQIRAFRNPG